MGRSVRVLTACFALTVQISCGLERVELGAPDVRDDAGITAVGEPSVTEPEDAAASPDDLAVSGELPVIAPLTGLGGASSFDFPADPALEKGCKKVDFLFVIDNSPSMAFAQENLKNSFPGFLDVLGQNLEANDFHIMVVDTDSWDGRNEGVAAADDCSDRLGGGRRSNGQNQDACQLADARRFISLAQPELDSTFSCMATVGALGDAREQQAGALLAAVSSVENDAGGCNEGFLRPDAILVVTLITNTDDDASSGEPSDWYDALLAQKDGKEASVVVLGFVPGHAFVPSSSGLLCNVFAAINQAPRLTEFVNGFTHHAIASVCEADYGPEFSQAVDAIDLACSDFVPPVIH